MATSKKQKNAAKRKSAEAAQRQRKMERLGVTSLPEPKKHASKKGKKGKN